MTESNCCWRSVDSLEQRSIVVFSGCDIQEITTKSSDATRPDTVLKAKLNRNAIRKHRYHALAGGTMISAAIQISHWRWRMHLRRSRWRVTKIFVIFCASICVSFVKFYHWFVHHIETLTNNDPLPSSKHVKPYAKDYKLQRKLFTPLLPSP